MPLAARTQLVPSSRKLTPSTIDDSSSPPDSSLPPSSWRMPSIPANTAPETKIDTAATNDQKNRSAPYPNGRRRSAGRALRFRASSRSSSLAVSAIEWPVSAAIDAEPDTTAATPLATAIPALESRATTTVPVLSPLSPRPLPRFVAFAPFALSSLTAGTLRLARVARMTSAQPSATSLTPDRLDALREAVAREMSGVRRDLEALVRIPSVSERAFDQAHVAASAEAVAELLRGAGLRDVDVLQEGGAPAVVGHLDGPEGAPTVLLYAHHDVQPPGQDADWISAPFEPTERDGRLYGRGAADDKAGVMAHLAAIRAHDGRPPVNLTVFVEGEEESGSPSLGRILEAHRARLAADVLVLADSTNWKVGVPGVDDEPSRPRRGVRRGAHARPRRAQRDVRRRGGRRRDGADPPARDLARRRRRRCGARAA